MSTLILYQSRHGFAKKCTDLLVQSDPEHITALPFKEVGKRFDWTPFDQVVLGAPVYFGRIEKAFVNFEKKYHNQIHQKKNFFFIVSLSPRKTAIDYFKLSFAQAPYPLERVFFFGGGIVWKALKWWERFLLNKAKGISSDVSNFDLDEVKRLAERLNHKR